MRVKMPPRRRHRRRHRRRQKPRSWPPADCGPASRESGLDESALLRRLLSARTVDAQGLAARERASSESATAGTPAGTPTGEGRAEVERDGGVAQIARWGGGRRQALRLRRVFERVAFCEQSGAGSRRSTAVLARSSPPTLPVAAQNAFWAVLRAASQLGTERGAHVAAEAQQSKLLRRPNHPRGPDLCGRSGGVETAGGGGETAGAAATQGAAGARKIRERSP